MMRSPCEEWQGRLNDAGYREIDLGKGPENKPHRAHRLIWQQHHGHTDLMILHDCDNPRCINMDHLRAGTAQENSNDMVDRERHNNPKKTEFPQGHRLS